jgi:hypothetical protein
MFVLFCDFQERMGIALGLGRKARSWKGGALEMEIGRC